MIFKLAIKSLLDRKGSVLLTCTAMIISVFVMFGVEHIKKEAKNSFASTVSGVDLIVGARSGQLNLLLYSVFRIGTPVNNIGWNTYQKIANSKDVAWTIPLSLGDSHKGFRVLGTNNDYFDYFSYGKKQNLTLDQGSFFNDNIFNVVLGANVASKLNYKIGDQIVVAHGIATNSFTIHDKYPFKITGILKSTGTPVDQTVHVTLEAIEAIHKKPGTPESELTPNQITAFMLGLKSRVKTFELQRAINQYKREPLMAILPGVALSELWRIMAVLEGTLFLISIFVFVAALLGLAAMMAASIRERNNEIHLLRMVGASPAFIFILFEIEAILISVVSIIGAILLFYLSSFVSQELISGQFGLHLGTNIFTINSLKIVCAILIATIVVAAMPAFSVYRKAKLV